MTCNGETVTIGDKAVQGRDVLAVDGVAVPPEGPRRYIALNKPEGVVTTTSDPEGRKTVIDLLPGPLREECRVFPVGRLDMDSSGLILLTNDGFLAGRLLHPRYEVPREYVINVEPAPSNEDLARLREGVPLEDGNTGPAGVSVIGARGGVAQIRMTIHTGRKRQIRRSLEHLGYDVKRLSRVRYGSLGLGTLPPGQTRELEEREVRCLYRDTGLSLPASRRIR